VDKIYDDMKLYISFGGTKTRLSTDTPDTFSELNKKAFLNSSSGKAFPESDIEALVGPGGHGYGHWA